MNSFTKLFSSITESSVWFEPDHTRLVWITMLAKADEFGIVYSSILGLANLARVPLESAVKAVETLKAPDPHSRTRDFDGRRIEDVDGGYRILNYGKYRTIRNKEDRRIYMRDLMRKRRLLAGSLANVSNVSHSKPNAEAEAEAEYNKSTKDSTYVGQIGLPGCAAGAAPTSKTVSDSDWLKTLEADPAYAGMDVPREYAKMRRWCQANNRQPTRRRFVNWMNRCERPMTPPTADHSKGF
jgi:hypothetical protein